MTATVVAAFTALTNANATRPFITFYDDSTGERTELSAATLSNWVAKTANLLRDSLGLGAGDVAGVQLPTHWQTASVLLGCWAAGLAVGPESDEVSFLTAELAADSALPAGEVFAVALAPLGLPFRGGPPAGTQDYVLAARAQGDHFGGGGVGPGTAALADGTTHGELTARTAGLVVPGARVLVDGDTVTDPLRWLVAPIVAGGSIVLCRNLDPAVVEKRLATERATLLA